ncbi:MAG: hypothetical protein LC624_05120 [Halobacteriales archaeon]|nr:hypothetical protein [Halobacteriales archaeon]
MRGTLALLSLAALALVASPAQAMLIQTPLQMHADQANPAVGDSVQFTIDASNDSVAKAYAERTVRITWSGEGDEAHPEADGVVAAAVKLDTKAHAVVPWRVPGEAADRNLFVNAMDGNESLAVMHLRVGDAPPIAYAMGRTNGGAEEPMDNGTSTTNGTGTSGGEGSVSAGAPGTAPARTPGPELGLVAAGIAGVALLTGRRSR